MKKIICLLLIVIFTFALSSCTNNNNDGISNDQPVVSPSAYESLSDLEKQLFDAFIKCVDEFYNPSAVRFLQVSSCSILDNNVFAHIKIQGTNKLGGTLNKWYTLLFSGGSYTLLEQTYESKGTAENISVSKINKALNEYWEDMGI